VNGAQTARGRDGRYQEMSNDNIPSQKYRDTGIPRYSVTPSVIDNVSKNSKNSMKDKDTGERYTLRAALNESLPSNRAVQQRVYLRN